MARSRSVLAALPLLLIALAALAASAPAAPIPEELKAPVLYFPTKVGARWTYVWSSPAKRTGGEEVVEAVTAVEEGKEGTKVVTVSRVPRPGYPRPVRWYEVSARGVYLACEPDSPHEALFRVPRWVLKLPHRPGQTWDDGAAGRPTRMSAHGPEEVEVPAGRFRVLRVEYLWPGDAEPTLTEWLAPGVGRVKTRGWHGIGQDLKAFNPPKD